MSDPFDYSARDVEDVVVHMNRVPPMAGREEESVTFDVAFWLKAWGEDDDGPSAKLKFARRGLSSGTTLEEAESVAIAAAQDLCKRFAEMTPEQVKKVRGFRS